MRHCGNPELRSLGCDCLICFNKQCVCSYGKLCLRCSSFRKEVSSNRIVYCAFMILWTDKLKGKKEKGVYNGRSINNYKYLKVI